MECHVFRGFVVTGEQRGRRYETKYARGQRRTETQCKGCEAGGVKECRCWDYTPGSSNIAGWKMDLD